MDERTLERALDLIDGIGAREDRDTPVIRAGMAGACGMLDEVAGLVPGTAHAYADGRITREELIRSICA